MTLESIEKLRKYVNDLLYSKETKEEFGLMCDEIQAEIDGLLPVDADGVPWTNRDTEFINEDGRRYDLYEITYSLMLHKWVLINQEICRYDASRCRHVKPRTVEDVLEDCINEFAKRCTEGKYDTRPTIAKYAAELRMAGDGE